MSDKYANTQSNSTIVRSYFNINKISRLMFSISYHFFPQRVEKFIEDHFFVPKSYPLTKEETDLLNTAHCFELLVDDYPVKCWKWGKGPYIVLSHGWNGHGSQFIFFIRYFIQKGYSVITFDGPAHGQSAGYTSSYFQMTNAVRGIINYCGKKNISCLIGHSFGASAIINAVYTEKISNPVILISPALDLKRILENTFEYYGVPLKIFKDIILKYEKKYKYSLQNNNPANLISHLLQTILIIHDKDDAITPYQESKSASNKFDNVILFSTQGLGHKRVLIEPQIINKCLDFIESI
jgi:predicted alpha/beta-fold hydrolase